MLKIGDFSRIAHVTVKTLRYYARTGLLVPVSIDRFSGYRYFTLDQLGRLNRILALKDLGFSLDQIRRILDQPLSADELRGMLRLKQSELSERIAAEQIRLARVEQRLEQIETEGGFNQAEIVLRRLPAQVAATARAHAATAAQLPAAEEGLRNTIRWWLRDQKISASGPWFTLLGSGEYRDRNLEVEIGVQVNLPEGFSPAQTFQPVRLVRLPDVASAACFVPPADMDRSSAYELMLRWIESNGCRTPRGAWVGREILLADPDSNTESSPLYELQLPVEACRDEKSSRKERIKEMEPIKFVNLPPFKVMGMKYRGKNLDQEVSKLWNEINMHTSEIPMTGNAYGICYMLADAEEGVFEYVAGFEVKDVSKVPEGMIVVDVPAARYAVFVHKGAADTLGETYHQIYEEWFPKSSFKPKGGYDMEVYDEDFKFFAPDSIMYIYEPVE